MSEIIDLKAQNLPKDCYVYKHSTRCPTSAHTALQIKSFNFSLPLYWVNVIEQRELSNWIAQNYGVTHQSPQLLKIVEGRVVKHWSHSDIITKAIE